MWNGEYERSQKKGLRRDTKRFMAERGSKITCPLIVEDSEDRKVQRRKQMTLGAPWVTQSVECWTLDFSSDHDLRVVSSSPVLGSVLGVETIKNKKQKTGAPGWLNGLSICLWPRL